MRQDGKVPMLKIQLSHWKNKLSNPLKRVLLQTSNCTVTPSNSRCPLLEMNTATTIIYEIYSSEGQIDNIEIKCQHHENINKDLSLEINLKVWNKRSKAFIESGKWENG